MRDTSIDQAKGILIFLVVLGHVAGMMSHFASGVGQVALQFVYKWIYLFHMPAFFYLAGVVAGSKKMKAVEKRGSRQSALAFPIFTLRKAQRLLIPYFFWGVVSVIVFLAMGQFLALLAQGATTGRYVRMGAAEVWWQPFVSLLHAGGWPHGTGFRCNSVLWFLPVMFVVALAYELFSRTTRKLASALHLISIPLLFVLGGVLRICRFGGLPWGLSLAPYYLAFMALGSVMGGVERIRLLLSRLSPGTVTALWGAFTLVAWALPNMGIAWWQWKWFVVQGLMAVWGSVLLFVTVKKFHHHAVSTPFPDTAFLASLSRLGLASLGIMVTHKFLVLVVQLGMGRFAGRVPVREAADGTLAVVWLVGALAISVGITYLTYRLTLLLRRTVPFALGEQKRS